MTGVFRHTAWSVLDLSNVNHVLANFIAEARRTDGRCLLIVCAE